MKTGVIRGTFQILHAGHVSLIRHARSFVDKDLTILIDSDDRVTELKGKCLVPAAERALILGQIRGVEKVRIFNNEEEFRDLMCAEWRVGYNYYFKGGDYKPIDLPEFEWLKIHDWTVCCIGHTGHSTSDLIKRIKE